MSNPLPRQPWLLPYLDTLANSVTRWGAIGQLWVRLTSSTDASAAAGTSSAQSHDIPVMLFRPIGAGGMGAALLVLDPRPGNAGMRVCKVMAPSGDPDRFSKEIRLLQRIHNPHVVRCFGAAEIILPHEVGSVSPTTTIPAYFMEYVQGGSLRDLLRIHNRQRSRRVPIREAFRMISQIVDATMAIHNEGVIHRDLKPDNILLDISHGRAVRICDLGIAREQPPGSPGSVSTFVGTPGYMAPEIAKGEPPVPATDYFAIGCILFEILIGQPAFAAQILSTTNQDPRSDLLDAIEQSYGAPTRTLVVDLLKKKPADRLHDPIKIHERIESILGSDLKLGTSLWKNDWPPHDRDARQLNEYVGEEKSWFGSGKLNWAGCLIGLHSRRKILSEFSQLIEELRSRLFSMATPLALSGQNSGLTAEMLQVTMDEFLLNLRETSDWLRVRLTEALKSNLSFLAQDREVLFHFDRVVMSLELEGVNHARGGPAESAPSSLSDLVALAGRKLKRVRSCWRICLRINDRVHKSIAACSDQLVAAVARMR